MGSTTMGFRLDSGLNLYMNNTKDLSTYGLYTKRLYYKLEGEGWDVFSVCVSNQGNLAFPPRPAPVESPSYLFNVYAFIFYK